MEGGPGLQFYRSSAYDSCAVWTLAGLRCLKCVKWVGPKSWAVLTAPLRTLFLEDLAKKTSANGWSA